MGMPVLGLVLTATLVRSRAIGLGVLRLLEPLATSGLAGVAKRGWKDEAVAESFVCLFSGVDVIKGSFSRTEEPKQSFEVA